MRAPTLRRPCADTFYGKLRRAIKYAALAAAFLAPASGCAQLGSGAMNGAKNDAESSALWPAPTSESKPWCFWWWPGSAVDAKNITFNLEAIAAAGFGGVTVVPIYGVKGNDANNIQYLTPQWMAMLEHATREAKRLGMQLDMSTTTGWPFGGPDVAVEDGDMTVAYVNGAIVTRPGLKVKRAAPGGVGLSVNPYSTSAMDKYLKKFDAAFDAAKASDPQFIMPRAQYHDSFEYKGNWSSDFLAQFQKLRGYDLNTHLPELFGEGEPDTVARIKADYRLTLGELHLDYIRDWVEWSHAKGCVTRNQAHGSPGNLLDLYAAADIAETETFGSTLFEIPGFRPQEENARTNIPQPLINRMASSAAHVAGHKLVASESLTWLREHFQGAMSQAKPELDRLFINGINHIVYHGCCYSPAEAAWPGWLFYASWEPNPRNALWRDLPALNAYVARCQAVLQSGRPDSDILLYWPLADVWHSARGMQNGLTVHNPEWMNASPCGLLAADLIKQGRTFDFISDAQLEQVKTVDGRPTVAGLEYRTILVPKTEHMPVETMAALLRIANEGATVIFSSALPADVPGFNPDARRAELKSMLAELKLSGPGSVNVGKGTIVVAGNPDTALDAAGARGEAMSAHGLEFVRRRNDDGASYFVANLGAKPVSNWTQLNAPFASVAILDPVSGKSGAAMTADGNRVYLQLAPGETCILRTLGKEKIDAPVRPPYEAAGAAMPIDGAWGVSFIEGAPEMPPAFTQTKLASWTEQGGAAESFAGAARYAVEFEMPKANLISDNWRLNLGDVRESARVRVNGRDAGCLFANPYTMEIGPLLKPGKNTLEVEVTNVSANRIRDLDKRGVQWKIFNEINYVDIKYKPFDASNWPLLPSGLLGPVTLTPLSTIKN